METTMSPSSSSTPPVQSHSRRNIITIITVLVLAVAGYALYRYLTKPLTEEQRRVLIVEQVAQESLPIPDEQKATVIKTVTTPPTGKNKTPELSEAQRTAIIQSLTPAAPAQ